jgi:gliding motility-associated-like protein
MGDPSVATTGHGKATYIYLYYYLYFIRMNLQVLFCIFLFIFICPLKSQAQLVSAGHVAVEETNFQGALFNESIYIFSGTGGNLTASLAEVPGELNFEWSLYNPGIADYEEPFKADKGTTSSVTGLSSGGYRVRISNGNSLDTLFRAWVFISNPSLSVEVVRHDCTVIDLRGTVNVETFRYFDPRDNSGYELPADYEFFWTAEPFIPISSSRLDPRIWDPPPVETRYTLTTIYYSFETSNSVTESPVTTKAGFQMDVREGEAPLEVNFDAGESLNASEYYWYFDHGPGEPALPVTPDDNSPDPAHTYYIPGEYYVTLRTVAGLCDDIFSDTEPVKVYPSELEVPNVFTPNGDGYNDVFLVRAVSLREYHAEIFNRYGRKVHESRDPDIGWDGKSESGTFTPGVYYYVITGRGWDDREYEFKGPLYLYRSR